MKFYKRAGYYIYDDTAASGKKYYLCDNSVNMQEITANRLQLTLDIIGQSNFQKTFNASEIVNADGVAYGTTVQDVADGVGLSLDVTLQDQDTPVSISKFNQVHNSTTLAAAGAIDDRTITVASATGIVVGSYLLMFHPASIRYMVCGVVSIASSPVIDIDTPLDFAFPIGSNCDVAITNMNVDGSSTTQAYGLRGTGTPPGIELTVDITRILFLCECTSPIDLSQFANFVKLTYGIVMRKRDGTYQNIFNVKSNGAIEGICFDFTEHSALNPAQGVDGFSARLTWAGQEKMGVVQRLRLGEDLEVLIQDDLETAQSGETITLLEVTAEGSIVRP